MSFWLTTHLVRLSVSYCAKDMEVKNKSFSVQLLSLDKVRNQKCVVDPIIRLIPEVTVDNNLGPDRLSGPKALDPNYYRQPTL